MQAHKEQRNCSSVPESCDRDLLQHKTREFSLEQCGTCCQDHSARGDISFPYEYSPPRRSSTTHLNNDFNRYTTTPYTAEYVPRPATEYPPNRPALRPIRPNTVTCSRYINSLGEEIYTTSFESVLLNYNENGSHLELTNQWLRTKKCHSTCPRH